MDAEQMSAWENNQLPELSSIYTKSLKLGCAIESLGRLVDGQPILVKSFNLWFYKFEEAYLTVLDGAAAEMRAGIIEAELLVLQLALAIPGHWERYRYFRKQFNKLMDN